VLCLQRDKEHMKSVYKSVVMETAYPLLHLQGMPEARWADAQLEQVSEHSAGVFSGQPVYFGSFCDAFFSTEAFNLSMTFFRQTNASL